MNADDLFALRAVASDDFGLLGGYDDALERLHDARLILQGGTTKWLVSDAGWLVLGRQP